MTLHPILRIVLLVTLFAAAARADTVWLDDLQTDQAVQPWGRPHRNFSSARTPLRIAGKAYAAGVGVQASSEMWIALGRGVDAFHCAVGLDDAGGGQTAEFVVAVDGAVVFKSGPMHKGDAAKPVDLKLTGKSHMLLSVRGDAMADWADAAFETAWSEPTQAEVERAEPYILTPVPGPAPKLNSPLQYGVRPGTPVQFTIPCTGERPMKFSASGLPAGLTLDADRGWIVGHADAGQYPITLTATNDRGTSTKTMTLVAGDKLCLTPPLGWSSWNVWCAAQSQDRTLAAADAMVKFDLIDHGYTFVNIDDGWQDPVRGGQFNGIQADAKKFPDIRDMVRQIHARGLKAGIYSGPWTVSYCGFTGGSSDDPAGAWSPKLHDAKDLGWHVGKYNFAENDAKEWASWGMDYLKYDWYPNKAPEIAKMGDALRATGRDIVYSVSNSAKTTEAAVLAQYAQLWRASGDIRDTWPSLRLNGFGNGNWAAYAQPGGWPDADMMVVGRVGFGMEGWGQVTHPSRLTPDEQYTHVSLWSLMASPLILGCDLSRLDPFTIGLITNDEVIAIDQDPLGKAAAKVSDDYFHEVWSRPLHDGALAVGVFNVSPAARKFRLTPGELGLTGRQRVRDAWRQKDLGELGDGIEADVPAHGVLLGRRPAGPVMRLTPFHDSPSAVFVFAGDARQPLRGERRGDAWSAGGVTVHVAPGPAGTAVRLHAPDAELSRVALRWPVRFPGSALFLGDAWERGYGDLQWRHAQPERVMPWYFAVHDPAAGDTAAVGVKTQPAAMCFWTADRAGVTLWLDLRNGAMPSLPGDRVINAATIVTAAGASGQTPMHVVRALCVRMCDRPRLPATPVCGNNNWYYAYGRNFDADQVRRDAALLADLAGDHATRPYCVIDAGWSPGGVCPGGPWSAGRPDTFPDMPGLADDIRRAGVRPGIWVRPTALTLVDDPVRLRPGPQTSEEKALDLTLPQNLAGIHADVARLRAWGYDLIKHDFSTWDALGRWGFEMGAELTDGGWHLADRSLTNAEVLLRLYRTIRDAAGDAVLIGCNTVGHFAAGLFEVQRTGDDTSGRVWERTRRMGVNTLAYRLPQHGTFFSADADCVAHTDSTPWDKDRQWLDLVARSGTPLFVSVDPTKITPHVKTAMTAAMRLALSGGADDVEPLDWLTDTCPARWRFDGQVVDYDWLEPEGAWPLKC